MNLKNWHIGMPLWYHDAFHISTYIAQYQHTSAVCPTVDLNSLPLYACYPPYIVKPKGRPKYQRITKRKRSSTSIGASESISIDRENEDDAADEDDDIEILGVPTNDVDNSNVSFLPMYLRPDDETKEKTEKTCGC